MTARQTAHKILIKTENSNGYSNISLDHALEGSALSAASLPPALRALIFGLFELTGGVAEAAALPCEIGAVIAAFISGWSGFSVHFQIMSICADRGISFKPYFLAKFAQGIVAAVLVFLFL